MRQQKLYEQHNTSLKNFQNAEAQLAALRVVAPLSGTITRVNVRPGQAVDVNTVVAELADLNRLAVSASDSRARGMNELKAGDEMQLLTAAAGDDGDLFVHQPRGGPEQRHRFGAWACCRAGSGLRPGQFVQLRIVTAVHTNCLAAPEESVVTDIDGQSVHLVGQRGRGDPNAGANRFP